MSDRNHIYDVNGNYHSMDNVEHFTSESDIEHFTSESNIEHFGISIGNKTVNIDKKTVKDLKDLKKSINNSMVVKGMTKMLSAVMNDVANENSASLQGMLKADNAIELGNVKTEGTFSLTNIKQISKVDSEANIKASQKIKNKITAAVSKKLTSKINSVVNSYNEKKVKNTSTSNDSTNVGDTISSLGKDVTGAAAKILSVGIGNSTKKVTDNTKINQLKKDFKLDNSFTMAKNKDIADKLNNTLSSKNLAKCVKKMGVGQKLKVGNINAKLGVKIADINQVTDVKSVLNCAFNQSVLTEIATKIVADLDNNISRMQKSADKYSKDNSTQSTSGDIAAVGNAGKAMLQGVGQAAVGVGKGLSTAAEGLGKGVSTAAEGTGKGFSTAVEGAGKASVNFGKGVSIAAEGVGKGVGSIFSGMSGVLMWGAIAGVVALIVYGVYKYQMSHMGDDDSSDSDD